MTKHAPMLALRTARALAHSVSSGVNGIGVWSLGVSLSSSTSESSSTSALGWSCGSRRFGTRPNPARYATRASSHLRVRKWSFPSFLNSSAIRSDSCTRVSRKLVHRSVNDTATLVSASWSAIGRITVTWRNAGITWHRQVQHDVDEFSL